MQGLVDIFFSYIIFVFLFFLCAFHHTSNFKSLYAVPFFVWAAHKNFAVLVKVEFKIQFKPFWSFFLKASLKFVSLFAKVFSLIWIYISAKYNSVQKIMIESKYCTITHVSSLQRKTDFKIHYSKLLSPFLLWKFLALILKWA